MQKVQFFISTSISVRFLENVSSGDKTKANSQNQCWKRRVGIIITIIMFIQMDLDIFFFFFQDFEKLHFISELKEVYAKVKLDFKTDTL